MRHIIRILSALTVSVLLLAGCAGETEDTAESTTEQASEAAAAAGEEASEATSEMASAAAVTGTVTADDQSGDGSSVDVASATLEGIDNGWVVIHQSDEGAPGAVIGWAEISGGENTDVVVDLEESIAESQELIPMLHVDDNEVGTYEFSEVEGADLPVTADGQPVITTLEYTVEG